MYILYVMLVILVLALFVTVYKLGYSKRELEYCETMLIIIENAKKRAETWDLQYGNGFIDAIRLVQEMMQVDGNEEDT